VWLVSVLEKICLLEKLRHIICGGYFIHENPQIFQYFLDSKCGITSWSTLLSPSLLDYQLKEDVPNNKD
jgi:hypothetical protein